MPITPTHLFMLNVFEDGVRYDTYFKKFQRFIKNLNKIQQKD